MRDDFSLLSDEELVRSLMALAADERKYLVSILQRLAEADRRKLAVKAGFPSLLLYCLHELRFSEGEMARRIHAARAAAKYPVIFRLLRSGRLTMTAVSLLAPNMTEKNYRGMLKRAYGPSMR